jgi:hypothetical protein
MPSLSAEPGFECFFKACRKGDATGNAVTVGDSAVRVLADASEITGLPRDSFEVHEISKAELGPFVQKSSRPAFVTSADSAPSLAASDPQA